jgi:hypothetical protein
MTISGCVLYDNGGDGVEITGWNSFVSSLIITRNLFVNNGGYGLSFSNASASATGVLAYGPDIDANAYYGNTSGERNDCPVGYNDITLTADPFVDSANGDFNINNTAGGGAALRAATLTMPG